jgi:amidohydrolase family protein
MFGRSTPIAFVNGRIVATGGIASSLRFSQRVLGIDEAPHPGDHVMDLEGAFVLPGLINAHDHLELNHYGRLKQRERYDNAAAWIDDMRPVLRRDAGIRQNSGYPLRERLFIGGLKNVLAGVTTVAHHNPIYSELRGRFPVRLVREFGWAHSFQLEDQPVGARGEVGGRVRQRCFATPETRPFIVHAAEGVDQAARDDVARLETLGCLRRNTVLVHGVALNESVWKWLLCRGSSLIWCPASNDFLFGRTIPVRRFLDSSPEASKHLCLGSDSRITGSRDLLDELRAAHAAAAVTGQELMQMVTTAAADVLQLPDAGRIAIGRSADLLVIPPTADTAGDALLKTTRSDVSCVTIAGRPMVGDQRFGGVFKARRTQVRMIVVDGIDRLADGGLAQHIARCPIHEPGVASVV